MTLLNPDRISATSSKQRAVVGMCQPFVLFELFGALAWKSPHSTKPYLRPMGLLCPAKMVLCASLFRFADSLLIRAYKSCQSLTMDPSPWCFSLIKESVKFNFERKFSIDVKPINMDCLASFGHTEQARWQRSISTCTHALSASPICRSNSPRSSEVSIYARPPRWCKLNLLLGSAIGRVCRVAFVYFGRCPQQAQTEFVMPNVQANRPIAAGWCLG